MASEDQTGGLLSLLPPTPVASNIPDPKLSAAVSDKMKLNTVMCDDLRCLSLIVSTALMDLQKKKNKKN